MNRRHSAWEKQLKRLLTESQPLRDFPSNYHIEAISRDSQVSLASLHSSHTSMQSNDFPAEVVEQLVLLNFCLQLGLIR